MRIYKPDYYDRFRCLAGACPDSCCKDWSVQVDDASAAYYHSLPGPLGERLRQVLTEEDGESFLSSSDGRCPMWRQDGLCRIQAELGEGALCKVCREFPRLTHDYGDFVELGLELSCPEAAKWILTAPRTQLEFHHVPGGRKPEYDEEAMALLLRTREEALSLLDDRRYCTGQVLALLLLYGCQVQGELDAGESQAFHREAALETAAEMARLGDMGELTGFFLQLELLTEQWRRRLLSPTPGPWQEGHRALARYFVQRYWLQAVSDYDLYSRVKLTIVSCLLVRHLGGPLIPTAQLFSKEIENNADNVDAILDAAYTAPAFRDDGLLGLLLEKDEQSRR